MWLSSEFLTELCLNHPYEAVISNVHYGTLRGSGLFQNLYFESTISNPIPE